MAGTLLYPIDSVSRRAVSLNGIWGFQLDPEGSGAEKGWTEKLPSPDSMPVPASFQDLYTDKATREYCGDFWYERDVFVPAEWLGMNVSVRFGCATHTATVFVNGHELTSHEGGFLPFSADISDIANYGRMNHIAVRVNNELSETRMPCGAVQTKADGRKKAAPYFDFYNFSGLQRNVFLVAMPKLHIYDYDLTYTLDGSDADINYSVKLACSAATPETADAETVKAESEAAATAKTAADSAAATASATSSATSLSALAESAAKSAESAQSAAASVSAAVTVQLFDESGELAAESTGREGVLHVRNAKLWKLRDAHLYTLVIRLQNGGDIIDEYSDKIGIRTVEIKGRQLLLNGEPVYLKGYGKHEDADIIGRGFSQAVMKRDFELMKWSNANSFRTSHYPYSEEIYQMADREGFLVIDEVQAVGCFPSLINFAEASSGKQTAFFAYETTPQLMEHHKNSIEEMIRRDKNHPCVIAWSLLNEPDTGDESAARYFEEIFDFANDCDPQKRPRTFALLMNSRPETCKCHQIADFLSFNRYYGWYVSGGPDIDMAEVMFRKEMDAWMELEPDKPMLFTEYGADTHAAIDKLPSVMWSESYQIEVLEMCSRVFDSYDAVIGEQVWNFADFQTTEGIMRVDGNKKGIFTRQRQPKRAAFWLKDRWAEK